VNKSEFIKNIKFGYWLKIQPIGKQLKVILVQNFVKKIKIKIYINETLFFVKGFIP